MRTEENQIGICQKKFQKEPKIALQITICNMFLAFMLHYGYLSCRRCIYKISEFISGRLKQSPLIVIRTIL